MPARPLPTIPGTVRSTWRGSNIAGQQWANVMHFRDASGASNPGTTEIAALDAKLVRLARNLRAKLYTNDHNLGKIAELQSVNHVNLHELAKSMRTVLLPGEVVDIRFSKKMAPSVLSPGFSLTGTIVIAEAAAAALKLRFTNWAIAASRRCS